MTNKEVVINLRYVLKCAEREGISEVERGTLEKAIKCVELIPELVEALKDAADKLALDWDGDVIENIEKIIDKAKELVE